MPQTTFFFFIWTTPPATFLARHYRCIESICRHHPRGVIRGLSNTLPTSFFDELKRADVACDVEIERYDLAQLVQGSITQVWYDFRRFWNRSAFFPNHEADLLRLLTLRDRGGTYVDTDVIFVSPLALGPGCPNAVGIEAGDGGMGATQAAQQAKAAQAGRASFDASTAVLCNAVMHFQAGAPLLQRAIDAFVRGYVPYTPGLSMLELHALGQWGAMGPVLLSRMVHGAPPGEGTCVLERNVLFPLEPGETASYFGPWDARRDAPVWERLHTRAVAVHLWNALTKATSITCGSLVHRLLEENCVVCKRLGCESIIEKLA